MRLAAGSKPHPAILFAIACSGASLFAALLRASRGNSSHTVP